MINWDQARKEAHEKASRFAGNTGHAEGSPTYCERYNGFYAGYMECAGERESLRTIVAKLEKTTKEQWEPSASGAYAEVSNILDKAHVATTSSLEDFI